MQEARLLCWHPFSSAWYVKHINWGKWSRLSGGAIPQLSLPRHKCALRFCKKIPCRQEEERFRWWSDRLQHRRPRRFTGWSKLPATDPWCNSGENNTRGHWGLSGILISVVKAEHVALSINQASFKLVHYVAGDPITGGGKKKQFPTFPSHVPCTNALCQPSNYPISGKDPCRLLSSLGLLPSPARFTSITAPHFYRLSKRMKGISCSIPCQKSASKVRWRRRNSWWGARHGASEWQRQWEKGGTWGIPDHSNW